MKRYQFIPYDLEATPLQIKTDSILGSDDYLTLCLYTADNTDIADYRSLGYFRIKFRDIIYIDIFPCGYNVPLIATPPPEINKIWTITKTSTSISIGCNGVQVLDFHFSDSQEASCDPNWSQAVAKIVFWVGNQGDDDNASDGYRGIPKCVSLPEIPHLELKTGELPVNQGSEVEVKCSAGYRLDGDDVITCNQGDKFVGETVCLSGRKR